jgi:hypothetical protein
MMVRTIEVVAAQIKEAAISNGLVINESKIHDNEEKYNIFRARSDNR